MAGGPVQNITIEPVRSNGPSSPHEVAVDELLRQGINFQVKFLVRKENESKSKQCRLGSQGGWAAGVRRGEGDAKRFPPILMNDDVGDALGSEDSCLVRCLRAGKPFRGALPAWLDLVCCWMLFKRPSVTTVTESQVAALRHSLALHQLV